MTTKHLKKMESGRKNEFLIGLNAVSAADSPAMYYKARQLFVNYWKDEANNGVVGAQNALEGFKYWCQSSLEGWYVGYAPGIPMSNNANEATNLRLKDDITNWKLIGVMNLVPKFLDWISYESYLRKSGVTDHIPVVFGYPTDIKRQTYEAAYNKVLHSTQKGHGTVPVYFMLGFVRNEATTPIRTYVTMKHTKDRTKDNAKKIVKTYHENSFASFGDYLGFQHNASVLTFSEEWGRWKCSCYDFGREFVCVDSIALDHMTSTTMNTRTIPLQYRSPTIVVSHGKVGAPCKENTKHCSRFYVPMPTFHPTNAAALSVEEDHDDKAGGSEHRLGAPKHGGPFVPSPTPDLTTFQSAKSKIMARNPQSYYDLPASNEYDFNLWATVARLYQLTEDEVTQLQFFRQQLDDIDTVDRLCVQQVDSSSIASAKSKLIVHFRKSTADSFAWNMLPVDSMYTEWLQLQIEANLTDTEVMQLKLKLFGKPAGTGVAVRSVTHGMTSSALSAPLSAPVGALSSESFAAAAGMDDHYMAPQPSSSSSFEEPFAHSLALTVHMNSRSVVPQFTDVGTTLTSGSSASVGASICEPFAAAAGSDDNQMAPQYAHVTSSSSTAKLLPHQSSSPMKGGGRKSGARSKKRQPASSENWFVMDWENEKSLTSTTSTGAGGGITRPASKKTCAPDPEVGEQRTLRPPSTGAANSSNNFTAGCTVELRPAADHVSLGLDVRCRGRIRVVQQRTYTIEWSLASKIVKVCDVIGKHLCAVNEVDVCEEG